MRGSCNIGVELMNLRARAGDVARDSQRYPVRKHISASCSSLSSTRRLLIELLGNLWDRRSCRSRGSWWRQRTSGGIGACADCGTRRERGSISRRCWRIFVGRGLAVIRPTRATRLSSFFYVILNFTGDRYMLSLCFC